MPESLLETSIRLVCTSVSGVMPDLLMITSRLYHTVESLKLASARCAIVLEQCSRVD